MTGVILAGGENLRIPLLKGYLEINGTRIIDSSIKLLEQFFNKVVIITNTPESYFYCGVPIIGDIVSQRGPATGILSALLSTEADEIFVVACDMPFIKPELIRYIVDKYKTKNTGHRIQNTEQRSPSSEFWAPGSDKKWDAAISVFGERLQPLLGIYSKNIIGTIERRLNKGLRSMKDMLAELKVLYINEEEVSGIDPEGRSFVNINTIEDYKKLTAHG